MLKELNTLRIEQWLMKVFEVYNLGIRCLSVSLNVVPDILILQLTAADCILASLQSETQLCSGLLGVHQDSEMENRKLTRLSPYLLTDIRFSSFTDCFQITNLWTGIKNEPREISNSSLKQYLSDSYSQETKKYPTGKILKKYSINI